MVASIDGHAIHHWSGILVVTQEGAVGTKDAIVLSIKFQCLGFMLIDEISMVSAELLGAFQHVAQQVVKARTLRKKRPDGSTRLFGGIDVFGDWWQLRPVAGIVLFGSPSGRPGGVHTSLGIV